MYRRIVVQALKGLGLAALLMTAIAITSGVVLTHARLDAVLREALTSKTLNIDSPGGWTECGTFAMEYTREADPFLNAIETRWPRPAHHPCDDLKALIAGPPYPYALNPPSPYVNYPFGARHLAAIAVSVLTVSQAETMYRFLSYAAVVLLFLGAWRNSERLAIGVVLPIAFFLTFAFEQHRYGDNLLWAPSFFVGFAALGVLLALPRTFASGFDRVSFYCFLGAMIAYFDVLEGAIPVLVSLAIVLNHFFFVARRAHASPRAYRTAAAVQALMVFGCFLLAYVAVTGVRLLIISQLVPSAIADFEHQLSYRTGSSVIDVGVVHLSDVFGRLWLERDQMTGNDWATWLLAVSAFAWASSAAAFAVLRRRVERPAAVVTDLAVLAVAGAGIFVWYVLFRNHTYIHAWLMVRMLALPAAYGFVAAWVLATAPRLAAERSSQTVRAAT
ncbi:MAG: hypothetical protein JWM87_316 [Candidatus Eremiobacteraeota bacterium]|nr:hypothetical protein [Candidatus Eremiobacteraeota bacterium]